jgi:hypothetical protein
MKLFTALAVASALSFGATASIAVAQVATPQVTSKSTPVAKVEEKKDPNRMVCKKTPVIGTRFPTKVCRAAGEWERQAEIDKQDLDAAQRNGLASCGTNPCS